MIYYSGLEKYHFLSHNKDFRHGICSKKIPSQPWRKLLLENRMVQKGFLLVWGGFLGFLLEVFLGRELGQEGCDCA